ncbi:MAG: diguanylate cyclase [Defluviitaleaceae bacterium]|nr:diguanylate cyclase [Defluviitaleaceae bacterium]
MTNLFPEAQKRQNTVLIVDDDKTMVSALSQILSPKYTVYVARDGFDALEVAGELLPDIILLDIIMPGMNGYEVITALKKEPETRDIPVIFVSGLDSIPDEVKGLRLGAVDYMNKPFTTEMVRLRVGNHMQIINQMRMIEYLSVTDALTGVANRRKFNLTLDEEWQRALKLGMPLGLMLLDIDFFKRCNDNYGHLKGDEVLKTVACIIKNKAKRCNDFVARWGGEEFAVILPETDPKGAEVLAEEIRLGVRGFDFEPILGDGEVITISIGVGSVVPVGDAVINHFIDAVDKALYHSKQTGRDKVSLVQM